MKSPTLAVLLAIAPITVAHAQGKLIHVDDDGQVADQLPSCESLRDFSHMSPRSSAIVRRFWNDVALPYFAEGRRSRRAFEEQEKAFLPGLVVVRGPEEHRAALAKRQELERLRNEHRARAANAAREANKVFERRRTALLASLPAADRDGAQIAMLAIWPPAGACR